MDKDAWSFAGSRPANYPPRRLAAMSSLLARNLADGLFRTALVAIEQGEPARQVIRRLKALFLSASDPYWDFRYHFGGKRLAKPFKLVGEERGAAILVNVVLPVLLAYARQKADPALERRLHGLYRAHPRLPGNNVTEFMNCRVFGSASQASKVVTSARRQQGLYQIFKDFCERDDTRCSKCAFMLALDAPVA
jgi:hypothetical protein